MRQDGNNPETHLKHFSFDSLTFNTLLMITSQNFKFLSLIVLDWNLIIFIHISYVSNMAIWAIVYLAISSSYNFVKRKCT